ncbi:hypothetical protein BGV46_04285 [Serratia marcescens]|nr:hypothetical protein BGV45_04295 [Serratia marcescens]OHT39012.1 hypothetical protein BGV46_04285 [Serratia marcescens]
MHNLRCDVAFTWTPQEIIERTGEGVGINLYCAYTLWLSTVDRYNYLVGTRLYIKRIPARIIGDRLRLCQI